LIACDQRRVRIVGAGEEAAVSDDRFLRATLVHLDMVHNLSRRLTGSREEAEDLVQETYTHALQGWRREEPERTGAWLATICLNLARSAARRRDSRPSEVLAADAGSRVVAPADTAGEALARLDGDAVHRALQQLSEPQRVAITLMDLCGFTAAEVAELTDAPRGTVLARVHRGHKSLARMLAAQVTGHDPRP
jgi:RNA polymerase sigma-70 factor (ECF subfamily)